MRSMLNIRRRIRGVQSTQQVTRAMKMIAQSRLRRSQQQALTNRAFTEAVWDASKATSSKQPFWHPSQEGKLLCSD